MTAIQYKAQLEQSKQAQHKAIVAHTSKDATRALAILIKLASNHMVAS